VTRIVLDTDVVSYHRTGRLPAEDARLVAADQHCIAFATAGELWKGAQINNGAAFAAVGSTCGWPRR
jgi:predicted nucleic acid-binding protein